MCIVASFSPLFYRGLVRLTKSWRLRASDNLSGHMFNLGKVQNIHKIKSFRWQLFLELEYLSSKRLYSLHSYIPIKKLSFLLLLQQYMYKCIITDIEYFRIMHKNINLKKYISIIPKPRYEEWILEIVTTNHSNTLPV